MGEHRWRKEWFPDQRVDSNKVLDVLKARRQLAVTDSMAIPWMSSAQIAWDAGALEDRRWRAEGTPPLPVPFSPYVCTNRLVRGVTWTPVAYRDILAALNHHQAQGTILRLPGPLARNGAVWIAPLSADDAQELSKAFIEMAHRREQSRHTITMSRLQATIRSQPQE